MAEGSFDKRLIGPHLALGGGLRKAAARAEEIGATAVQIFTDNPTAWRRRTEMPSDLAYFREHLAKAGIDPIAIHAPYLVNLCGGSDDFWRRSVATMANELRVGSLYGARFVVMHIGSHRGLERADGIGRLILGLNAVLAEAEGGSADGGIAGVRVGLPMLVLENAAGTGDGIGSSLEDLADIWNAAADAGVDLDQIGFCLDTAHLWGAGFDVASQAGLERVVTRVDSLFGKERVVMLHLNDSRTTMGSRLDRHEHIAAGYLGPDGMREALSHPWLATLPTYLETPGMDAGYDKVNLERVRMLIAGETPPPLPPEAFDLRGSRTRTAPPGT